MANSVDPDQEQSYLDLHPLPRPICLKTWDHYSIQNDENGTDKPLYRPGTVLVARELRMEQTNLFTGQGLCLLAES